MKRRKLKPTPKKPKKRKQRDRLATPPWPQTNREVAEVLVAKLYRRQPRSLQAQIVEVVLAGIIEGRRIERGRIAMVLMHHDASTTTPTGL